MLWYDGRIAPLLYHVGGLHLMNLKFPWRKKPQAKSQTRTHIVSFHIPRALLEALDRLVEMGVFNNRSEAIRVALYKLISEYTERGYIPRHKMEVGYR